MTAQDPIRIGVSACLLGQEVRFDGQHKRDAFLNDQLAPFVEWVPICPEVEIGMGIPRESVRLVRGPADDHGGAQTLMLGNRSQTDWTAQMTSYARAKVEALRTRDLSGYVLKSNSPSCGMTRVKLYDGAADGAPVTRKGVGLFAAELLAQMPQLPIEEEGRLCDARLRDNFLERVFAYVRVKKLWAGPWGLRDLIAFHTNEKMALLAHSVVGYRALGHLVGSAKHVAREQLQREYQRGFMAVLQKLATPGRQANVLMHMLGHFSDQLDSDGRRELLVLIDDHRKGVCPLVVPLTLMRHHVRRLQVTYLLDQSYLDPHPKELQLRNHV
jgi:uncharacterized protein YbgA (DUF1722 family)/uncharacterized protein YbbK (DUF523 family)